MTDWKHVHQRLEMKSDKTCADAYFLNASKSDVKDQLSSHRRQIRNKRQVLELM